MIDHLGGGSGASRQDPIALPVGSSKIVLRLPLEVEVLEPRRLPPVDDVPGAIAAVLARPTGTPPFSDVVRAGLTRAPDPSAVVVVSDNTRPVPYTGSSGILWPLVERLLMEGFRPERVTVLVASGTHRRLSQAELTRMFDPLVMASGILIRSHDAFDRSGLEPVGQTRTGLEVLMDRGYVEADLRILTGLVESHLMAGASGGRKSICPGLVGIDSIKDFHGPAILSHPQATDLVTGGNPCHELSLEIAGMARAHFIVNVTAREDGAVMGVFAGDMEAAHNEAVDHLRSFVGIPLRQRYDVVITHGGKVGVNHYQAAKAAAIAARIVERHGHVILAADTHDPDPVGSMHYRALMTLLKEIGDEAFRRLVNSPDWTFVPDQWQAQMWGRVFAQIPPSHFHYFSPQTPLFEYDRLPGRSPQSFWDRLKPLPPEEQMTSFVEEALKIALREVGDAASVTGRDPGAEPRVAVLTAGPYGIPVRAADGGED